jgi:hypothetical protein
LTLRPEKSGVPHLSRLLRKVGTTDARSAVLDVGVVLAIARVGRTLLSVAFGAGLLLTLRRFVSGYAFRHTVSRHHRGRAALQRRVRLIISE